MSRVSSDSARQRAGAATILFCTAGVVAAFRVTSDWTVTAPLLLTYAALIVNTYFSVRYFGPRLPSGPSGRAIDAVLVLLYLGVAASLDHAIRFIAMGAMLFAVATLKYAVLLDQVEDDGRLARKVRVNTIGTLIAVTALLSALGGHARLAAWSLLAASAVMHAYVLWARPLYR